MGKKSDMRRQTHLVIRGTTYYFRCAVPTDLLEQYHPRREIKRSLKTGDLQTAIGLAQKESVRVTEEFNLARQRLPTQVAAPDQSKILHHLDDDEITRICNRLMYEVLTGDEEKRRQGLSVEAFAEMQSSHNEIEAELKTALARGDSSIIAKDLHFMLHLFGLEARCDDDSYKRLAYAWLQSWRKMLAVLQLRNAGEVAKTEEVVDTQQLLPVTTTAANQDNSNVLRLDDLFDAWEKASPKRPRTIEEVQRVVKGLKALIGDKPAAAITRKEIISYRDHLLNEGKLHHATVGKKIGMLHSLFQQALDDEKISANPSARIKIPKPKVEKKRRAPYSFADIKKILGCEIYTQGFRPRAKVGEAAAWLPLMALYTGARLEELGQLLVSDFHQHEDYGWYMEVIDTDDEDEDSSKEAKSKKEDSGKNVKTDTSRRRVPLHPNLINAGLLRYREQIQAQGHTRLFPILQIDCKGSLTGNFSKWWSGYSRKKIGMGEDKVFHSTRHAFKDACREAGISEEVHDALTGHAGGGVGRSYGGQFPLKPLFEAINRIEYPGVVVPVVEPERND